MSEQQRKLELNWMQAAGSGLAALSSAVLLSTVGVAGTVIGAAIGSVVITVGSAFYSHYLTLSRERMAAARQAAVNGAARVLSRARTESAADPGRAGQQIAKAQRELHEAEGETPPPVRWQDVVRRVRWKPVLLVAGGVFVVVMGTIVSMELMTGRALSSYTGGSSADGPRTSIPLGGAFGREDRSEDTDGSTPTSEDRRGGTATDDRAVQPSGADSGDGATAGDPPAVRGFVEEPAGGTEPSSEGDTDGDSDTGGAAEPAPEPTPAAPEPSAEPTPEPTPEEPVEEPEPAATASPTAPDAAATPQPAP